MLDTEDLKDALNVLDRMIGDKFKQLGIAAAREAAIVQLYGTCRACNLKLRHTADRTQPGFSKQLVQGFLRRVNVHWTTKHSSPIILPPSHHRRTH